MAVPAWVRIWLRVKDTISWAMSVSRIRLSEAERFSVATDRLEIVCSRRFWTAPRLARLVDTVPMALSRAVMADEALFTRSRLDVPRIEAEMPLKLTARVSPLLAPIWNVWLRLLAWLEDVPLATPTLPAVAEITKLLPLPTDALLSSTFHTPPPTSDTVALSEPAAAPSVVRALSMAVCSAVWYEPALA